MIRKRFLSIAMAGTLTITLLCSCGEKQMDYNPEDPQEEKTAEENTETDEETTEKPAKMVIETGDSYSLSQFADAEKWSEELEGTWEDGSTVTFQIMADVTVPDEDSMSVIEVSEPEVDAAYCEQIVKAVFGENTVYYNDDAHLPKDRLEEMISLYEMQLEDYQVALDGFEGQTSVGIESVKRDMQAEKDEVEEKLEICKEALKTATSNDYTVVTDYNCTSYRGYRNGEIYTLDIKEQDTTYLLGKGVDIYMSLEDSVLTDITPTEEEAQYLEEKTASSSEVSEQEAQSIADRLMEEMGMSCMIVVDSEKVSDGYYIYYELGMDTLSLPDFGTESDYSAFSSWAYDNSIRINYSMDSYANIHVTEDGFVDGFWISNPVEITNVIKEVNLLSLENIESIMRNALKGNLEEIYFEKGTGNVLYLDALELIYFRVQDTEEEGYYSYIPVWRLSDTSETKSDDTVLIDYKNILLVNAIDGSIIDYYSELSEGGLTE